MGGMFHGGTALGGGVDNRVKSIQTRSGHRVIFTEDESIVITDKSGNEIHLDTTGSNINITAPETINIKCNNLNIDVAQNMNTTVGENQNNSVGMNISESAGMNKTSTVGLLNMLSVGTDFITNVTGKMVEFITGHIFFLEKNKVYKYLDVKKKYNKDDYNKKETIDLGIIYFEDLKSIRRDSIPE